MSIAICVSGQFRGRSTQLRYLNELAEKYNATIFFSTWSRIGSKASGTINSSQAYMMFGRIFAGGLPEAWIRGGSFSSHFPQFESLAKKRSVSLDSSFFSPLGRRAIIDVEDEFGDLSFISTKEDSNSLRMLYKWWRCNQMKRRYEEVIGIRFNSVIRIRPDMLSATHECVDIADRVKPNSIFIPWAGMISGYLTDVASVCDSMTSDIESSLFGKAVLDSSNYCDWSYIHNELFQHFSLSNIKVNGFNLSAWLDPVDLEIQSANRQDFISILRDHSEFNSRHHFFELLHILSGNEQTATAFSDLVVSYISQLTIDDLKYIVICVINDNRFELEDRAKFRETICSVCDDPACLPELNKPTRVISDQAAS